MLTSVILVLVTKATVSPRYEMTSATSARSGEALVMFSTLDLYIQITLLESDVMHVTTMWSSVLGQIFISFGGWITRPFVLQSKLGGKGI